MPDSRCLPPERVFFYDLTWFASDRDGHLAVLTQGSATALPMSVASDADALAELEHTLLDVLVEAGGARLQVPDDGHQKPWREAAAHSGLYAYDAMNEFELDSRYRLIAAPTEPLSLGRLPTRIQTLLGRVAWPGAPFGSETILDSAIFGELARRESYPGADVG